MRFPEECPGAVEGGAAGVELVAFGLEAEEDRQIGFVVLEQFGHHAQGVLNALIEGSLSVRLTASRRVRLGGGGVGKAKRGPFSPGGSGRKVIRHGRCAAVPSCVGMPFPVACHGPRSPLRCRDSGTVLRFDQPSAGCPASLKVM
ncbi:hypothetical protein MCRY_22115 [Marivita cryptomonadis]|nr:hypothetical protein MCRY_22115 [Marivita cryptomonadis]